MTRGSKGGGLPGTGGSRRVARQRSLRQRQGPGPQMKPLVGNQQQ